MIFKIKYILCAVLSSVSMSSIDISFPQASTDARSYSQMQASSIVLIHPDKCFFPTDPSFRRRLTKTRFFFFLLVLLQVFIFYCFL